MASPGSNFPRLPLVFLLWLSMVIYMVNISHDLWQVGRLWFECFTQAAPLGDTAAMKAARMAAWSAWEAHASGDMQSAVLKIAFIMAGWSTLLTIAGYWLAERLAIFSLQMRARIRRSPGLRFNQASRRSS